jgi:hypothetical protein
VRAYTCYDIPSSLPSRRSPLMRSHPSPGSRPHVHNQLLKDDSRTGHTPSHRIPLPSQGFLSACLCRACMPTDWHWQLLGAELYRRGVGGVRQDSHCQAKGTSSVYCCLTCRSAN